jgi:hypothetical protein
VLIVSPEFISSRQPMQALHLLLQRQGRGSAAKLLPVLHGLSRRELTATLSEYRRKAYDALKQQWAADLDLLLPVPGVYADEVCVIAGISGKRIRPASSGAALKRQLPCARPCVAQLAQGLLGRNWWTVSCGGEAGSTRV